MVRSCLSVLMSGYLDPAQVALGRLVLDMKNPGQNFCPYGALKIDGASVSKAPFSDLKSLANAETSSHFKGALSRVLTIFADKSQTTVDEISTKTAIRHQLLNVDVQFESILEDDNVKKWLEKVILTGTEVYMVVGLHTLQDASISLNRDTSKDIGGNIQAPIVSSIAPASGDALDVNLESGHTSKSSLGASFVASGERIIAVQYQKVVFQMSSSKGANRSFVDAVLKRKTVWQSFGAARGGADLDTFEAMLAKEATTDDIGEDIEFEVTSTDSGEVFVILS